MKLAVFDTHKFDQAAFSSADTEGIEITFYEPRLNPKTAELAKGHGAVCVFVNDDLDRKTLSILAAHGVKLVALRCAGFNQVDVPAAYELGIKIVRVPEYSPHAVAEHAVALLLCLNRKLHKAYLRVREGNFSLDGLVGFDCYGKTVGVVGTGKIGACFAKIMHGFGCRLLAYDVAVNPLLAQSVPIEYVALDKLFAASDIISLHVPLLPVTHHMIHEEAIGQMKAGVILLNTSRGGLIDTAALIQGLKSGKIGAAALDVYEEEEEFFFQDLSGQIIQDDVLARLLTFPNVMVTSHQAFLTREALKNIAETTIANIRCYMSGGPLIHEVLPPPRRT